MELDSTIALVVVLVLSCCCLPSCGSVDRMKIGESITGNQKLVSDGERFSLGFFSPGNSTFSYLGVWFTNIRQTVVWVANRESPVPHNSTPTFTIGNDGNFQILDQRGKLIWSSNVSLASNISTVGILYNDGNLVLKHGENNERVWRSFQHPTDTLIRDMDLGFNKKTGQGIRISSWTSDEDPRPGNFTFGIDPESCRRVFIWKHSRVYYRFVAISGLFSIDCANDSYASLELSTKVRVVLKHEGYLEVMRIQSPWKVEFQAPRSKCELYALCGPFGRCDSRSSGNCTCLEGFEPKSWKDWENGKWDGGCVRKTEFGCDDRYFFRYENTKFPDNATVLTNMSTANCETHCINNCSCTAYAGSSNNTCLIWFGDLMDLADFTGGRPLYVRLHDTKTTASLSGNSARRYKILVAEIVSAISAVLLLISIMAFIFKRKHSKLPDGKDGNSGPVSFVPSSSLVGEDDMNLVQCSLQKIRDATNNFHDDNKLGEGGFGPVFKGFLAEFGDVAIKRLCKKSSQGLEEFMNELKLIAKLQHKNLVSLLGCCVEGEEKILIYECMPNCSLDKFLFDPSLKATLNWSIRFGIIEGIAQGMLYLHKYSRLKVIHRDLKVSNILLDGEMIPKISDFGMARIFGTDQTLANTKRVVGTYGYISPEYVVYGQFSEKSDVFSFGVLLLEILTGERNSDFYMTGISVSLLGWAWNMRKEGRILELIDPSIRETCDHNKATRSVLVALLCVQEVPTDRPTMSDVVAMLSNETIAIPEPKEPAFHGSWQPKQSSDVSINAMTFTLPLPR